MEAKVSFDEAACKGCGLCVAACPKKIIALSEQINVLGYHPARVEKQDECISCALCARMCPDCVISVYR
ncbi:MAG: 4Fe-4S dicluster domain-containing protein [Bacillota bacterium]